MSQIPNYFARQPVSRLSPTAAAPTQQQGRFGDAVDAFQAGGLSAIGGIFDFVGADGIAKQFYGWSDKQQDTMSDRGKAAMGKSFFDENEQGETVIGEGLTDIDTWLLTLANVAGQFVPTAIPGAGAAGAVAKAASLGAKGRAAANVVSMGATGGAAATGQGMEQAREEARNIPDALKAESPLFRDVFRGIHQNNPGWTDEQKWDAATEVIANKVADEVRSDPKVLLANFGAAAIGDPIIGRALMGARLAKSGALRSAAKGFVVEGSTEAAQAGVSQYGINQALQPLDNRDAMRGVKTAALNEGIAGGGFGAGAGLLGGLINRNQPEQQQAQDNTATPEPVAPVDPAVAAIAESNPGLASELNTLDQKAASRKQDVQGLLDIPTAARNAGFGANPQDVGRFGDMLTSPVQQSIEQMRAQTVADLVAAAAAIQAPTPQDRFSPVQYQFEGEVLPADRQQSAGALPGATIPGEQARFIPDRRIEGEYQQPIRTTPRPQGITDKGIIFAGDNRPAQQAQERADNLQRDTQRFADNARSNYQPRIPQKDIIFAGNESGVTVKQSGKPFQSPKEALASKSARDAKRSGAQVEAVPFADGYGWTITKKPAADLAGQAIDNEWTLFADNTGTKKIPRAEMPQIKAEHRGAMVQFMKGRNITHEQDTVPAVDLKPTQAEFSPAKVKKAMEFEGGNRSILVSSDGYVLDGHHQWLAAREKGDQVDVIRLNAPIERLVPLAKEFPSSTLSDQAAVMPSPETDTAPQAEQEAQAVPAVRGKKARTYTPASNKPIDVEYRVVEADSLVTSNDFSGAVNPNYPAEMQPRNRSRQAYQVQVNNIAKNPIADKLLESPDTDRGAPVVRNGVVESGNGRSIGLREAYRTGKGEAYKQALIERAEQLGLDPEQVAGMRNPVLVRERLTELSPTELREFTVDSNQSAGVEQSPAELARTDASLIDDALMSQLAIPENGDVLSPMNERFIRGFAAQLGNNEVASYKQADGQWNKAFKDRLLNAIFAKGYDNAELLNSISESTNPESKNLLTALMNVAGKLGSIRSMDADIGGSLSGAFAEAAGLVTRARREGTTIDAIDAQADMLTGHTDADIVALAKELDGMIRSGKRMTALLDNIASTVLTDTQNMGQTDIFTGEPGARPNVNEVIRNAAGQQQQADTAGTPGLFDSPENGRSNTAEQQSIPQTTGERESESQRSEVSQQAEPTNQTPADAGVSVSEDAESEVKPAERKATKRNEKLQDAGDSLFANKKGWFSGSGIKWSDIANENDTLRVSLVSKQKVWPKPNWETIINSAPEVEREAFTPIVHMVKQVYDAISTKPTGKADQALQDYIEAITKTKEAAEDLLSNKEAQFNLWNELASRAARRMASPYSIGSMATKGDMAPIFAKVFPQVAAGARFKRGDRENDLAIQLGSKAIKAMQFDASTAVNALKDIDKGWPAKQEAWQKQGYSVVETGGSPVALASTIKRKDGDIYSARVDFTRTDNGKTVRVFLGSYDSYQEAKNTADKYANENAKPFALLNKRGGVVSTHNDAESATDAARSMTKRETGKTLKDEPLQAEDVRREGPERRKDGRDVSSQELMEAFGFRGVNFGNWVKANERQWFINQAYDGFYDLAETLDLPPKAISLNGMLGVAFGAQGNSGANAHFVPGFNEINLTKNTGAGALAHEWGHALDHYFGVRAGLGKLDKPFATSIEELTYRQKELVQENLDKDGGIRSVIRDAFVNISALLKEKTETMEAYTKRIRESKEKSLNSFDEFTSNFKDQLNADGKAALNDLRAGNTGEYVNLPPPKGKRKSPGAVYQKVKDVADSLPEYFADPKMVMALHREAISVYYTSEQVSNAPALRKIHTDFYSASRSTDASKGGKSYWSTNVEMFARAFESYVMDRMAEKNQINDFLVRPNKADRGKSDDTFPYPAGIERKEFNALFDTLLGAIETKESDDGNVILFSKANYSTKRNQRAKGVPVPQVERIAQQFMKRINGGAGINVVVLRDQKEAELAFNQSLSGSIVRGAYNDATKTAYLIADNFDDIEHARRTLAHEVIAHGGLQSVIGAKTYRDFLTRINATRTRASFRPAWNGIMRDYGNLTPEKQAEEFFARWVEDQPEAGSLKYWWKNLLRWLNEQLAKVGITRPENTDVAAMRNMLDSIVQGFKSGKAPRRQQGKVVAFDKKSQTQTPAFKKWFGDSKVVDEDGQPLVVYHGTGENFSKFSLDKAGNSTDSGMLGKGIYFSSDPEYASRYAIRGKSPAVMPVYVSLKKPWVTSNLRDLPTLPEPKTLEEMQVADIVYSQQMRDTLLSKGYDGVIYTTPDGKKEVVAFSPNQIKSATGNDGSFDAGNDNIMFSRTADSTAEPDSRSAKEKLGLSDAAEATLKQKATERYHKTADTLKSSSFWRRLNEGIFDGMHGIKAAEESVGITDPNNQGYVSARLASGLADVLHGVFSYGAPEWRDGVVARKAGTKGLLEVFSSLGDDLNNWLAWMGANRAEKLMAEGRENNLTAADIAELKALAAGKEQQFEAVRQEYNKINSAIIDLAQQAGLISEAQRSGFDEEWYVPFFRDMDVDPEMEGIAAMVHGPKSKNGIANQNAQLKELKGGAQSTKDLLENIIQRQSTLIDAALKNHAMLEIVGNLSGTDYMQPVTSPEIAALSQTELNLLKKVKVMRDGKPEAYTVSDPALLRGLLQINDAGSKSLFNRLGRSAKRFLTAGITLSPDFIVKNFVRDAAHAWMVNKDDFKFGADSIKGLRKAFKEDEAYRDLIFSGAAFQGGYVHGADPEAAAQQVRRALKAKGLTVNEVNRYMGSLVTKGSQLLERYRNASDKVENANRLSTYEAALAAGKSARQAAFEAKDLMDYSLKGNFALIGSMIDFLPFFNARLQGLSKLVRAAKAGDGDRVLKVLSANLAMKGMKVAAFSLALAAMNNEDERYQELADWDKDANWHFWLGDDHIRIPKPFELGIIFGTFPERMLHYGTGAQPASDLGKAVGHAVFNTLALNPIPQLALPAVEVMVNRSFFKDSSIEGMADENRQPGDRYNAYTSEVAKQLGQLFNVSPKKIEHLVTGYTGTIGGYVLGASDIVARQMLGIESADTPISRYPVVKAFYQGDAPKTNTKFQQEFYDALNAANQAYGSYKRAAEEGNTERQQALLEDNSDKLRSRVQLNRLQRQLSELNKQAERVNNNSVLSSAQKREQLDAITRRKNAVYQAAYVRFNLGEW